MDFFLFVHVKRVPKIVGKRGEKGKNGTVNIVFHVRGFQAHGVLRAQTHAHTRARAFESFVREPRGYGTVSACFAVWDQDPKVRLDRHRHKNSGGQRGQQRGPVFPGPPLSCDMLLVRYDSGVSIPAFCSVSDNARDAFVPAPRAGPPFSLFLPPSLLSSNKWMDRFDTDDGPSRAGE